MLSLIARKEFEPAGIYVNTASIGLHNTESDADAVARALGR